MTNKSIITVCLAVLAATLPAMAEERPVLSLAPVQPFGASSISVTGRVHALVVARIGSRINGRIEEFGKDAAGNMLDEGMSVKAGDVLFRIDGTVFRNNAAIGEASLKLAQATLDNLVAKVRPERLEQLKQVLAELDARIADRTREEVRFKRLVEEEKTLPVKRLEEVQTELAVLKAQRATAQARLDEAVNGPTATEIAVAKARVEEATTALKVSQDDLRDTTVRAPYDGIVTKRLKSPGDYVTGAPQTEVIEVTASDKLEAELRLPESYLDAIVPDKTVVALRSPLLKGALKATVSRVVRSVDKATGTFAVRVPLPAGAGLVNGAFVTGDIDMAPGGLGMIVPLQSVVTSAGESCIFLARDGKMVRCPVQVAERLTECAVVKGNLDGGQKVLVGPAAALQDGAVLPAYLLTAATQPAATQPAAVEKK
jgi:RND family efflux transporter MFP subunit